MHAISLSIFFAGFILTSPRSVESVKEAADHLPDAWKNKRHYCVGMQTRNTALRLLGDLPHLTGEQCGNAISLSEFILNGDHYGMFFLFYLLNLNHFFVSKFWFSDQNFSVCR